MLHPWKNKRLLSQGVPLGNIPARWSVITTDASLMGWGAVWEGRPVRGFWEPPWTLEHINVLELRAVYLSLRAFLPSLQNKHVLVRTDNMSAVYHINHQGGTRSARCLQVTKKLLSWSSLKLLSLKAVYIPGVANKAADLLSRTGPLPEEWCLHPEVVRLIWGQFGMAKIDLFATVETAHCNLWFSLNSHLKNVRKSCCMLFLLYL